MKEDPRDTPSAPAARCRCRTEPCEGFVVVVRDGPDVWVEAVTDTWQAAKQAAIDTAVSYWGLEKAKTHALMRQLEDIPDIYWNHGRSTAGFDEWGITIDAVTFPAPAPPRPAARTRRDPGT